MANITISNSGPKITEKDIKRVENELKIMFPTKYRKFLLKYNGGVPNKTLFRFESDSTNNESVVDDFLSINPTRPDWDITKIYHDFYGRLPFNMVPIATDPGGNVICISVKGKDKGLFTSGTTRKNCPGKSQKNY